MIHLDRPTIETALPLVGDGLEKYCWLRAALPNTDVSRDREFQRRFNGFYRVRRNAAWQATFYALLEQQKHRPAIFASVLRSLHDATGRIEASFASKLTATVDPDQPVIDAIVLMNLHLRLPYPGPAEARLQAITELHDHSTGAPHVLRSRQRGSANTGVGYRLRCCQLLFAMRRNTGSLISVGQELQ